MSGDTPPTPDGSDTRDAGETLRQFVAELLAVPGSRVNIERGHGRRRLRYMSVDATTSKTVRKSLELPADDDLIASLETVLRQHRLARKIGNEGRALLSEEKACRKKLRKQLLAACPSGRVMRRRIGLVFDIAANLGFSAIEDFLKHEPWHAKPHPAGRRRM